MRLENSLSVLTLLRDSTETLWRLTTPVTTVTSSDSVNRSKLENSFFETHSVFNATDAKRVNDVRWCLTLVMTILSTYFNRDTEHEEFLARYNDGFPQEESILDQLERTFSYIENLRFDQSSRVWQKTDLFTLLVELNRILDSVENYGEPEEISSRLTEFSTREAGRGTRRRRPGGAKDQGALQSISPRLGQGANDRSSRIRRGHVIAGVLKDEPFLRQPRSHSMKWRSGGER